MLTSWLPSPIWYLCLSGHSGVRSPSRFLVPLARGASTSNTGMTKPPTVDGTGIAGARTAGSTALTSTLKTYSTLARYLCSSGASAVDRHPPQTARYPLVLQESSCAVTSLVNTCCAHSPYPGPWLVPLLLSWRTARSQTASPLPEHSSESRHPGLASPPLRTTPAHKCRSSVSTMIAPLALPSGASSAVLRPPLQSRPAQRLPGTVAPWYICLCMVPGAFALSLDSALSPRSVTEGNGQYHTKTSPGPPQASQECSSTRH